jgi:CrcB protein
MKNLLLVGLGGMLGTIIRYVSYIAFGSYAFPYVTLIINITGSFIIGAVTATALKNTAFADWRLFLATGLCGGFTTFSAFSMETLQLLQQNRNIAALIYILSSFFLGISAAIAGYFIGKQFF